MRDGPRGGIACSAGGGIKLGLEPLQKSVLVAELLFERVAKFAFSVVSDVPLLSEGRSGAVGLALNSLAMGEYEEDDVETLKRKLKEKDKQIEVQTVRRRRIECSPPDTP